MKGQIPFTDEQLASMKVSYLVGASLDAVALEFGVDRMAVSRRLKSMGVKMRRPGSPRGPRKTEYRQKARALLDAGHGIHGIAQLMGVGIRTVYRYLENRP